MICVSNTSRPDSMNKATPVSLGYHFLNERATFETRKRNPHPLATTHYWRMGRREA
jgi:hypothetical protein